MTAYSRIFEKAWDSFLNKYQSREMALFSEADLQGWLFHECIGLMEREDFEKPYPVSLELEGLSGRADLEIGYREHDVKKGKWVYEEIEAVPEVVRSIDEESCILSLDRAIHATFLLYSRLTPSAHMERLL